MVVDDSQSLIEAKLAHGSKSVAKDTAQSVDQSKQPPVDLSFKPVPVAMDGVMPTVATTALVVIEAKSANAKSIDSLPLSASVAKDTTLSVDQSKPPSIVPSIPTVTTTAAAMDETDESVDANKPTASVAKNSGTIVTVAMDQTVAKTDSRPKETATVPKATTTTDARPSDETANNSTANKSTASVVKEIAKETALSVDQSNQPSAVLSAPVLVPVLTATDATDATDAKKSAQNILVPTASGATAAAAVFATVMSIVRNPAVYNLTSALAPSDNRKSTHPAPAVAAAIVPPSSHDGEDDEEEEKEEKEEEKNHIHAVILMEKLLPEDKKVSGDTSAPMDTSDAVGLPTVVGPPSTGISSAATATATATAATVTIVAAAAPAATVEPMDTSLGKNPEKITALTPSALPMPIPAKVFFPLF
jgi:hypothetical protein